jgi:hypothetical protein
MNGGQKGACHAIIAVLDVELFHVAEILAGFLFSGSSRLIIAASKKYYL